MDLVVIGGGFWGVAASSIARERGLDTLLIDNADPNGASRNAAGIVCLRWYRQDTVRHMLPDTWSAEDAIHGLEWLAKHVPLARTGEQFLNATTDSGRRYERDCYLVSSCEAVLELVPKWRANATRVTRVREGWRIGVSGDGDIITPRLIVAAGTMTDNLLASAGVRAVGVTALRGRALLLRPPQQVLHDFDVPLTVLARPYTHFTFRRWGSDLIRLGDTVERQPRDNALVELRTIARRYLPESTEEVGVMDGLRPVCGRFHVAEHAPGLVAATGGHRVGLALAEPAGRRAVELALSPPRERPDKAKSNTARNGVVRL